MSKALVFIKSRGMGDICILSSSINALSLKLNKPVTILAQKNTRANALLKHNPYVEEVIELEEKGFFSTIKKIRLKNFDQSFIYSDSVRLYLISKLSGIKEIFHYPFFSKKGKNFFKTAKGLTEKILEKKIDPNSKIFCSTRDIENARKKFNITNNTKNIVFAPSASGPTKRWDIENYIELFKNINKKYPCKFFIAGGFNDQDLVNKIIDSTVEKNCISFSKMTIEETLPIIAACKYYIGNDTGWGHISAGLNLKSLFLFMDSPPLAYGVYSKNISIIVPDGETIESCKHNTRGKDKIPFEKVLDTALKLLN